MRSRIFNTYGPRMHPNDGRVVSNFIVQALLGRDITVYGKGMQTRSFCYVDDLIDGLVRLMSTPTEVTGPVNIDNPAEFKIIELAQMVLDLVGSRSRIVRRPLPENDPKQRQPDISLAQELLGWKPRVALKEGLTSTIGYFERLLSDSNLRAQLTKEASVTA
jgi:UDP-glucuronate decarboxylase